MRSILICGCLFVGALGLAAPQIASAQIFPVFNPCCRTCGHQHCTCTTVQPIVETRMRQEQVVTVREVKQAAVQQQTVYETVPVTTVQNVTVDEGGYQMVWVPRPVTKQIATTELQTRVSRRSVPLEITHRVPEVSTRLVPEQTVRYVTQTHTAFGLPAPIVSTAVIAAPALPMATHILPSPAVTLSAPVPSTAAAPTAAIAGGLVPDASYAEPAAYPSTQFTTISAKTSRSTSAPAYDEPRASARRGLFVPAPSAATVWQSQQGGGRD